MTKISVPHILIKAGTSYYSYESKDPKFPYKKEFVEKGKTKKDKKYRSSKNDVHNYYRDMAYIGGNLYKEDDCHEIFELVDAITPKVVTEKAKMLVGSVFTTSEEQPITFCYNQPRYCVKMVDSVLQAGQYVIVEIDREVTAVEGENIFSPNKTVVPTRFVIEDCNGKKSKITVPSLKKFDVVSYPTTYSFSIMKPDGSFYTGVDYYSNRTPRFDTYGKAKKFKDISKLKAGVMYFIGYTSFTESMEIDEFGGDKLFDFDPSWRAVKVDKLTNTIVETIDIMPWLTGLLRLKPITVKFGGAVRSARKDFENKKYDFPFVAVKKFDLDKYDEPIKVKGTSLVNKKVTPCKIYTASDSVAIACSKAAAVKIKFSHDNVSIIDLDSLAEFIEE